MTASLVGKNAGKGTRANLFRLNEAKAQMKLEPGAWYGRGDRSYRVFKPGDEIFDATMRNEVTLVESMADDLVKALGNRYRTYVTHPVSIVGGSDQEPFHIYGVLTVDCPRVGDLDSKVDVAMVAVFSTLIAATYEV